MSNHDLYCLNKFSPPRRKRKHVSQSARQELNNMRLQTYMNWKQIMLQNASPQSYRRSISILKNFGRQNYRCSNIKLNLNRRKQLDLTVSGSPPDAVLRDT
jgi:outer membrane usher protein FimD/PapC